MNIKELFKSMSSLEESKSITYEVIVDALHEGLEKAFRKHTNCPDAMVRVEIIDGKDVIVYQQKKVVEDVEDDEIEISVEDAREVKKDAQVDDIIESRIDINEFSRASVTVFKNILTQKLREAGKEVVYNEYIDKVDDLVTGVISNVEEKFVLVDLGKTLALMLRGDQIPGEVYREGDRIKVIIRDVNKESKGAQVIVSRSSANLVKRLFESKVTEIYDGTVEIKAIARIAGERTKMAVYSKNINVDAIGSCIGQRGARVVEVIDEITGKVKAAVKENIDIVEWNKDFVEYAKNVMKPATVLAVIPNEEDDQNIMIVVDDNQLSLAIGKKGINAKLANQLLGKNITIKTKSDVEELGIDWQGAMLQYQAKEQARIAMEDAQRIEEERIAAEKAREEFNKMDVTPEEQGFAEAEEITEVESDHESLQSVEKAAKEEQDKVVEEIKKVEEDEKPVEKSEDEKVEEVVKKRKPKLVKAEEYVSKFEDLADAKKTEKQATGYKKKKNKDDDEEAKQIKEKLEKLKGQNYEIKPEYTDEEIEEFENAEDEHWYDNEDAEEYEQYEDLYEEK